MFNEIVPCINFWNPLNKRAKEMRGFYPQKQLYVDNLWEYQQLKSHMDDVVMVCFIFCIWHLKQSIFRLIKTNDWISICNMFGVFSNEKKWAHLVYPESKFVYLFFFCSTCIMLCMSAIVVVFIILVIIVVLIVIVVVVAVFAVSSLFERSTSFL